MCQYSKPFSNLIISAASTIWLAVAIRKMMSCHNPIARTSEGLVSPLGRIVFIESCSLIACPNSSPWIDTSGWTERHGLRE